MTMFMVLTSPQSHYEGLSGSFCEGRRRAIADRQPSQPASIKIATVRVHHRHLLLSSLLNPKAEIHLRRNSITSICC